MNPFSKVSLRSACAYELLFNSSSDVDEKAKKILIKNLADGISKTRTVYDIKLPNFGLICQYCEKNYEKLTVEQLINANGIIENLTVEILKSLYIRRNRQVMTLVMNATGYFKLSEMAGLSVAHLDKKITFFEAM